MITDKGEGTTSYLLIQDAELTDSGKYSCAPSNADMASVRVHVLNGKWGMDGRGRGGRGRGRRRRSTANSCRLRLISVLIGRSDEQLVKWFN